jgi:F-type H+-transporting ATPase subunit epsilon
MQLEIITPESNLFSGEVVAVQLPGKDGLFQVLNNHAPIISALTKGTIKVDLAQPLKNAKKLNKRVQVDASNKILTIDVDGGVVELTNNKLILLAE